MSFTKSLLDPFIPKYSETKSPFSNKQILLFTPSLFSQPFFILTDDLNNPQETEGEHLSS